MLMLKFGRLVDLEKLETVTVNRTVEELKEKLRQQESKSAAEIAKWNVSSSLKLYVKSIGGASLQYFSAYLEIMLLEKNKTVISQSNSPHITDFWFCSFFTFTTELVVETYSWFKLIVVVVVYLEQD